MDQHHLDPAKLTPLALETLRARDEIMLILDRLADPAKASMTLAYAAATWAARLSAITGIDDLICAAKLSSEIVKTTNEGIIGHAILPPAPAPATPSPSVDPAWQAAEDAKAMRGEP